MAVVAVTGEPYSKEQQLARGPKRYRRKVAGPKRWQAILSEKCSASCRICGLRAGGPVVLEAHHLVPRDRFGDDVPANIIGLCRDCHRGVTLNEPAHCRLMLTRLSDAEYAYFVTRGGEDAAERIYGIEFDRA